MPIQRFRSPVAVATVPRDAIIHDHHKEIDSILKDLKFCSRRLKLALDAFEDELRVLERLYYKCKNQHRTALFFRRVPEMRRYGRRVCEVNVPQHVDILRASFVGLDHTNDPKALKASWTHVPDKSYVYFLTERLTACSTLVCKMWNRLRSAYHHFTLAMQAGAFVQVIVLFVAISSRMSMLSSELDEALQLCISACDRILAIIHPTGTHTPTTTSQQPTLEPATLCPSYVDHDFLSEDTGQTISRQDTMGTPIPVVEGIDVNSKVEVSPGTQVTLPPSQPTNGGDYTAAQVSKRSTTKATTKVVEKSRVKTVKKKKLDEIDEIFGF